MNTTLEGRASEAVIRDLYTLFSVGGFELGGYEFPILNIQPAKTAGEFVFQMDDHAPAIGRTSELTKLLTSAVFEEHPTLLAKFRETDVDPRLWWADTVDTYRSDLVEHLYSKHLKELEEQAEAEAKAKTPVEVDFAHELAQELTSEEAILDFMGESQSQDVLRVVQGVQEKLLPIFRCTDIDDGRLYLQLQKNKVVSHYRLHGVVRIPFDAQRQASQCGYGEDEDAIKRCIVHALVVFYNVVVKKNKTIEDLDGFFYRAAFKNPESLKTDLKQLENPTFVEDFLASIKGLERRVEATAFKLPERRNIDDILEAAFADL